MVKKSCRSCKRIIEGNLCPVCHSTDVTTNFQGVVVIFDVESEFAKKLKLSAVGKYAIRV